MDVFALDITRRALPVCCHTGDARKRNDVDDDCESTGRVEEAVLHVRPL